MKSNVAGKNTSPTEVTNISAHGVWLFVNSREYLLSYDDFPWFKEAKVSAILEVKLLHDNHLFWPQLDVDLELKSLDNIEHYPLVYK